MATLSNRVEDRISGALEWLLAARDTHAGGWGVWAGSDSTVTNTTEALIALSLLNKSLRDLDIQEASAFLHRSLTHRDYDTTRHNALMLTALLRCGYHYDDLAVQKCATWLLSTRAPDGGWGHSKDSEHSSLFATFLGIRALVILIKRVSREEPERAEWVTRVNQAERWLISAQNPDGGWGFRSNDSESNASCTAYALVALCLMDDIEELETVPQTLSRGYSYLFEEAHKGTWENPVERMPNSQGIIVSYIHLTNAWVVMALCKRKEYLHEAIMYRALATLFDLQDRNTGSWTDGYNATVWATCIALTAILSHRDAFDYGVDMPKLSTSLYAKENEISSQQRRIEELETVVAKREDIIIEWRQFRLALSLPLFLLVMLGYAVFSLIFILNPPYNLDAYRRYIIAVFSTVFGIFPYLYARQRVQMQRFSAFITASAVVSLILALFQLLL